MAGIWTRFRSPGGPVSPPSPTTHTSNQQSTAGNVNTNFIPDPMRTGLPPIPTTPFNPQPTVPGVVRLRSLFSTLPHAHWYRFSADVRILVLKELWASFWGPYGNWFLNVEDGISKDTFAREGNLSKAQKVQRRFERGEGEQEIGGMGKCCEYVFEKGDVGYKCRDCGLDDACVMCARCFAASDHAGHIITFHIANHAGGYCDCGDPECWRPSHSCRLHSGPSVPSATSSIQVHQPLKESMSQTVAFALDFLLDTLDLAPDDTVNPLTEADITKAPTGDPPPLPVHPFFPTASGPPQNPLSVHPSFTSYQQGFQQQGPTPSPFAPQAAQDPLFAVVLWNDEKHSFAEVIDALQDATGCDHALATRHAERIHTHGRAVVDYSSDLGRLLYISKLVAQIDLGVTVRRASDTFREELSATIIEWLVDVSTAKLGGHALATRDAIVQQLFAYRQTSTSCLAAAAAAVALGNQSVDFDGLLGKRVALTRIEYLFCYHTRLWRMPRLLLKQVYVSLFRVSPSVRIQMAGFYAQVYHHIVSDYLLVDREAETSIKAFSEQLFPVPSVAQHLASNTPLAIRILGLLSSFFTNQLSEGGKCVLLPPRVQPVEPDVNSFPFRSKRFMPLFADLRALCGAGDGVARVLTPDTKLLSAFVDVCGLFAGINPSRRAAQAHVEYETDAWVSVFNVTLCLARCIRTYGEMYADARRLAGAISYVLRRALSLSRTSLETSGRSKTGLGNFHQVSFGSAQFELVRFDVLEGWISFHHPLHWLLAELLKHVDLLEDDLIQAAGVVNLRALIVQNASDQNLLIVTEFPLRVIVLVAQVRAGLWVRNGFAIRGQLVHYREYMLRELCYDQDLFLLQASLTLLDPQLVLASMLDRFQLLHWFAGRTSHPAYDAGQLSTMLEEFMYVLLVCVGEVGYARGLRSAANVRREVVHALALGSCSYGDLCKRVSDRIVEEKSFDRTLAEVANYKGPVGLTDVGMYELRDELFDEVDHFFYHFTRNRREEMEGILKARLKKKTGVEDPVIVPKPMNITKGPFATLPLVFHSEVLLQIMFYAIFNFLPSTGRTADQVPSYADVIIDQGLHLIMLALVEQPQQFTQMAARKAFVRNETLLTALCALEASDRFKTFRSRVAWCLDVFQRHVPDEVRGKRRATDSSGSSRAEQVEAAKKRAAKARQEAIMKQFAAAQQTFKDNNLVSEEDEEMEDDEYEMEDDEAKPVGTCIVCQEELDQHMAFGMLCSVQPSRIVRTTPTGNVEWLQDTLLTPTSLDRNVQPPFKQSSAAKKGKLPQGYNETIDDVGSAAFPLGHSRYGLHTSVCGHMMHIQCFKGYTQSVESRQQHQSTRNHPENISRREFVCPLCKSLGNSLLPVQDEDWSDTYFQHSNLSIADWMRLQQTTLLRTYQDRSIDGLLSSNGTGEILSLGSKESDSVASMQNQTADDFEWTAGDSVIQSARYYSDLTGHLRQRVKVKGAEMGAYLPDELCAYTLATMEIAQRGIGEPNKTVADKLSETQARVIRGLVFTMRKMAGTPDPAAADGGRQIYRRALCMRLIPEWARERSLSHPLLLRDPLIVLVETAAVAPEILHYVVVLMYYANLMRAAIGIFDILGKIRAPPHLAPLDGPYHDIMGEITAYFPTLFRHAAGLQQIVEYIITSYSANRVKQMLYLYTLPFLRRAAMLLRAVRPSRFSAKASGNTDASEYHRLMDLLNIPMPSNLHENEVLATLMDGWTAHYCTLYAVRADQCEVRLDQPSVYHLSRLPERLDTLFHNPKIFVCSRCHTMPQEPAICLFCGMVCCLQSHCCMDMQAEAGECNMHMRDCGGTVGLYFLVRKCSILYLHAGNGSYGQAPYVDEHGEIDFSMRRQRLQYLHPLRYEELRKQWLTHGIPAVVARKLDGAIDHGGWGTL